MLEQIAGFPEWDGVPYDVAMGSLIRILVAAVLVVGCTKLSAGQGTVENNLCFESDEILADVLFNFMLAQGITAMRCDALTLEGEAERGSGPFFNLHARITKAHADKFEALVSLEEVLGREKFGGRYKQPNKTPHFGTQGIAAVTFSATPAKCKAFMKELRKRSESFNYLLSRVLSTYAMEKSAYPPCE